MFGTGENSGEWNAWRCTRVLNATPSLERTMGSFLVHDCSHILEVQRSTPTLSKHRLTYSPQTVLCRAVEQRVAVLIPLPAHIETRPEFLAQLIEPPVSTVAENLNSENRKTGRRQANKLVPSTRSARRFY